MCLRRMNCIAVAQDEMLPPEHMRRLYELVKEAGSERVVWVEFPEGTHMDAYEVCRAQYWPALVQWFEQFEDTYNDDAE
jgi:fermentation-respiration switch protein FrsA (DUF1100 family)